MSTLVKNKIIAVFFLMVFSASTITGFACSVGIDMGYNLKHHSNEHNDAHAHHDKGHVHHHERGVKPTLFDGNNKDDCCTNGVVKLVQLDKLVTDNQQMINAPVYIFAFSSVYLSLTTGPQETSVKYKYAYLRRSCSLNDTDIRIAIQSFQI